MRTVGKHRSPASPHGDTTRLCSYCGVEWYRSQLRRDAAGLLACPDELPGLDSVTLSEGNAELASQKRMGNYDVASDGSVDSKNTVPSPGFVNPNGPPAQPGPVDPDTLIWLCPFSSPSTFGGKHLVNGYPPNRLATGGTPAITLDLSHVIASNREIYDLVVDSSGNLWVTTFIAGHPTPPNGISYRFPKASCLVSGAPSADIALTANAAGPTDAVWATQSFDRFGNLWVNDTGHGTFAVGNFLMYRAAKYLTTGAPVPDVQITLAVALTAEVGGFVFDSSGNMWSAAGGGAQGRVQMISAAQLLTSAAPLVPAVIWTGANWTGSSWPTDVTFDKSGSLWLCDYIKNQLRKYSIAGAVSGNQAALLTITSAGNISGPDGLMFDADGNLWVANDNDNKFLRFKAADLTTGGAKTPDVVLQPGNIKFGNIVARPKDPLRSGP